MPKRIRVKKIYQKKSWLFLKALVVFIGLAAFLGAGLFAYFMKDLPRPEKFTEGTIPQSTKIYDRSGKILLYEISGEEKRTIVPLKEIPDFLQEAVVAVEDKGFFQHRGLDFKAIGRAILYDLKLRAPLQGASTITQQLIRSYFLTTKKTLERKTREIVLSLELERRYSKEQIMEWYLNLIPFGGNLYGVEAASQTFFGKHVSEISLGEAALLAALIRAPSLLSPYGENIEQLLVKKDFVLEKMRELNFINKEELLSAQKEKIEFQPNITKIKAPHFVLFVKNYLEKKYGRDFLNRKGLRVYTTLDSNLQKSGEEILRQGVEEIQIFNAHNGGLLSVNPKTGEILVMVGSKDYFAPPFPKNCLPGKNCLFDPQVNTTLTLRQPGSALKPFVYSIAFLEGFTPRSLVWDVKTEFNLSCPPEANREFSDHNSKCYHPRNYDGKFLGPITLKSALAQSRNLPSVKVLYLAGLNKVLDFLPNFGITTLKKSTDYGLSLVLGGGEVKLLEMVGGYSVFANGGERVPLSFIRKITDSQGNTIEAGKTTKIKILPSQIAREINDILSDNEARAPMFGFHSPMNLPGFKAAAKTGTTQDYRDAWIIGYTPNLVTGVWVGNSDNTPMRKKPAVSLAGIIWQRFMEKALTNFGKEEFSPPEKRIAKEPILNGELEENHSILYFLNQNDPQYFHWEKGVLDFLNSP